MDFGGVSRSGNEHKVVAARVPDEVVGSAGLVNDLAHHHRGKPQHLIAADEAIHVGKAVEVLDAAIEQSPVRGADHAPQLIFNQAARRQAGARIE